MPVLFRWLITASAALPLRVLALFFFLLSGGLALLHGTSSLANLHALRTSLFRYNEMPGFVLQASPGRHLILQLGLIIAAVGAGIATYCLRQQRQPGPEQTGFRQELRAAIVSLARPVKQLSGPERLVGGGLLLVLLGLRLHYFRAYPLSTDEVATYDYFVSGGPVAITSFYPIPNNHILFSLSCWVVSWFTHHDLLVLRLPTLLISSAGTLLAYALLLRFTTFRLATLAVGLFCLSPLSLYYAVAGRGYFLLIVLAVGQFFAALVLLHSRQYRQVAWSLFVVLGVLGLYTIPTYAYLLVSLWLMMLGGRAAQQRRATAGGLPAAGLLTLAGALLLYSPVLCISGRHALLANSAVSAQALTGFWSSYTLHLRQISGQLFGNEQISAPAFMAVALASTIMLPFLPHPLRRVAGPALAVALIPLVLMPLQRVHAPARVLLYTQFFFFVAAAAVADYLLTRLRLPARLAPWLSLLLMLGYGAYQVVLLRPGVRVVQHQQQLLRQAYGWLLTQQPRRVFFAADLHQLYFHHYARLSHYPLQLFSAGSGQGAPFDLLVGSPAQPPRPPADSARAYRPVYHDGWVTIYAPLGLSAAETLPTAQPTSNAGK